MKTLTIRIDEVSKVKKFVNIISKFDVEADLKSGRHIVDAKSIMGIFSLSLSNDLELDICTDSNDKFEEVKNALAEFIVK